MTHSRFIIFISVLTLIFGVVWSTVWLALVRPLMLSQPWRGVLLTIFIGTFIFQFYRWIEFRSENPNEAVLLINYFIFGLFVYLFLMSLLKLIVATVSPIELSEFWLIFVAAGAALLMNVVGIVEAMRGPNLEVVEYKADRPVGIRVAQISDLHIGPVIKRDYVSKVVKMVNGTKPDLIVLTGDIGDGSPRALADEANPLAELKAPLGVFYVTGNHEYYWDAKAWVELIEKQGIKPLMNSGLVLDEQRKIYLGGATDITSISMDPQNASDAAKAMSSLSPEKRAEYFKIILAHQPKFYQEAEAAGFDLLMCGHTHRGQFFPFNFLVGFFNPFSHGLNSSQKMKIYVNSGTGFWGPPLRLGVPAEVTLLHIL